MTMKEKEDTGVDTILRATGLDEDFKVNES